MHGWSGTVLRVDLTREKVAKQPLDKAVAAKFIGGRGLTSKVVFDEVKPGIDPLTPENVLTLAVGPLTGTPFTSSSRIHVSTLSPYSYILGDGNSGGAFPAFLKFAGYDQIVVTGRASKPMCLRIDDDEAELRDASDLWGRNTWETTDMLQEELGKDFRVSCIGQAGENLVRFASMIFDKYCSAARGSGAVCGSKNLKAIAVRGTKKVEVARGKEVEELALEERRFFLADKTQREISKYGTHLGTGRWWPGYRYFYKYLKDVPTDLRPEGWKKYEIGRTACYGCVVKCRDIYRIPEGKYAGEIGSGLEYETIFCLGTNCGILKAVSIMVMGNLVDKYGMCSIPLGNTIAFAKDLFARGIITEKDTGGLSLDWEDADDQIELIHRTALREGFGNLVAEGMYSMAKIVGGEAMDYCYHVKGLCRGPADYPIGVFTLAHATSTRGADHLRGRSWAYGENDPEVFPELVKRGLIPKDPVPVLVISENAATLADALGRCKGSVNNWVSAVPLVFKYPVWDGVAKVLSAVTGLDFTAAAVQEALERIYTLERAFLVRQGITRKHDRLVQRPGAKGTPGGEEERKNHEEVLTEYYQLRGWDLQTGIPTRAMLERLGLKYVADELESHGPYPDWDGPPLWPLNKYPHGGKRV
ncbi:MAG: aldehyde ferredoxin oxidoreductase family protein [Candidatus Hodarchaeaceae archaeon]|nr:aldehyde ferredoxin oxidoreductase family protein [Candidatus Hodarchaeaceae archaeon]